MCYSAQVWQAYNDCVRRFGAHLSIREFGDYYADRLKGARIKTAKAMDNDFLRADTDETREMAAYTHAWSTQQTTEPEHQPSEQRRHLVDAEYSLRCKAIQKAGKDVRIAPNKVDCAKSKLVGLKRTSAEERASSIFPLVYALVIIVENGQRVIKRMRYQCRHAGKPGFYDRKYSATYDTRCDNLERFSKGSSAASVASSSSMRNMRRRVDTRSKAVKGRRCARFIRVNH